jgi:hypothetical protein
MFWRIAWVKIVACLWSVVQLSLGHIVPQFPDAAWIVAPQMRRERPFTKLMDEQTIGIIVTSHRILIYQFVGLFHEVVSCVVLRFAQNAQTFEMHAFDQVRACDIQPRDDP